jgi:hypothetical protein
MFIHFRDANENKYITHEREFYISQVSDCPLFCFDLFCLKKKWFCIYKYKKAIWRPIFLWRSKHPSNHIDRTTIKGCVIKGQRSKKEKIEKKNSSKQGKSTDPIISSFSFSHHLGFLFLGNCFFFFFVFIYRHTHSYFLSCVLQSMLGESISFLLEEALRNNNNSNLAGAPPALAQQTYTRVT